MKDKNERGRYMNQLQSIVIILGQANLLSNGIISNWTKLPLIIGKGCKV